jgi:hypothetical protein
MISGGLVMYPIGWDNREVRESCGKSANVYNLGEYRPILYIVFIDSYDIERYRGIGAKWCWNSIPAECGVIDLIR